MKEHPYSNLKMVDRGECVFRELSAAEEGEVGGGGGKYNWENRRGKHHRQTLRCRLCRLPY